MGIFKLARPLSALACAKISDWNLEFWQPAFRPSAFQDFRLIACHFPTRLSARPNKVINW
jgi:hypothetical protein